MKAKPWMTAGVTRPPTVRATIASPKRTPRKCAGSVRGSTQVITYRPWWGRNGRRGVCVRVSVAANARLRSSNGVMRVLMDLRSRTRASATSGRTATYHEDPAMHRVVALALPQVVAFDLSIPAQIFGHVSEHDRYEFTVCAERPGLIETTTGFAV